MYFARALQTPIRTVSGKSIEPCIILFARPSPITITAHPNHSSFARQSLERAFGLRVLALHFLIIIFFRPGPSPTGKARAGTGRKIILFVFDLDVPGANVSGVPSRRKKLKELNRRVRLLRMKGGAAMISFMKRHLNGHIQYYGVSGNSRSLGAYAYRAVWILFKWLNKRSQKRSITWDRYCHLLKQGLLPRARIIHNLYPKPLWMT